MNKGNEKTHRNQDLVSSGEEEDATEETHTGFLE